MSILKGDSVRQFFMQLHHAKVDRFLIIINNKVYGSVSIRGTVRQPDFDI